jgi:RNA polymerase sigma-70 factor (ECF subfamily)
MGADAAPAGAEALVRAAHWSDEDVVARVLAGEPALFEVLMRRHNQRVYRVARAILRDEDEIDDVLQDAYLAAYRHLGGFERRARFSTWLVRIVANQALDRRRRRLHTVSLEPVLESGLRGPAVELAGSPTGDPEQERSARELALRAERAIDALPESFRAVYVLRQVQGLATSEAADCLGIDPGTVKTRLHRARALLREALARDPDPVAERAFPFGGHRCDRLVAAVLGRLAPDPR